MFKLDSNTATQDSFSEQIEAEIKDLFDTENLNVETKEDEVLNLLNLNKSKYPHLASFAKKNLLYHRLLYIMKDYFLKLAKL